MKWAVSGRKIAEDSASGIASAAAIRMGAGATVSTLNPACAVAQIEQTWWEVVEFSGCACAACATPIAHTSAIASRAKALTQTPRFADIPGMSLWCADSPVTVR